MPQIERGAAVTAADFLGGGAFRAALLAPIASLVVIAIETAAYLMLPQLLINPIIWAFAAVVGLPMLYATEVFVALPLLLFIRRHAPVTLVSCALVGLLASVFPTWMWTEVIRSGPIPVFRQFGVVILMTAPAGAIGGALFWKIAVHADSIETKPA